MPCLLSWCQIKTNGQYEIQNNMSCYRLWMLLSLFACFIGRKWWFFNVTFILNKGPLVAALVFCRAHLATGSEVLCWYGVKVDWQFCQDTIRSMGICMSWLCAPRQEGGWKNHPQGHPMDAGWLCSPLAVYLFVDAWMTMDQNKVVFGNNQLQTVSHHDECQTKPYQLLCRYLFWPCRWRKNHG